MRAIQHALTQPIRRSAVPVLAGNGRGLRVRVGESFFRVASRSERRIENLLLELLKPGDVFYDVGANIGWYSLLAARRVGRDGQVFAFEPQLENAFYAQRNAQTNGFEQMVVVPVAVTDTDGAVPFVVRGSCESRLDDGAPRSQAERRAPSDQTLQVHTTVPAVTLDNLVRSSSLPPPTVVKIDVEGAEAHVLHGMREVLRAVRPTVIIELHATARQVADALDENGYDHHAIETTGPTRDAPYWAHILAVPDSGFVEPRLG
jgi:FkbM family methyltransferase